MDSLTRLEKEFSIENEEFIMYFDMRSAVTYQRLAKKTVTDGLIKLFSGDSEEYLLFIASTVRRKNDKEKKPLAEEVLEGNSLGWLLNYSKMIEEVVESALPKNEEKDSKKK